MGQSWSGVLGDIGFGDQILDRTTDCPVVAGVNGVGVQSPPQDRSTTQTVDGVEQGRQGPVDDYTSSASPPIAQSETATFANGWLTKMIKARLPYSNRALTRSFVVAGTGFEPVTSGL